MIGSKKVIGVCLTKINDHTRANYVSCLHAEATKAGYSLMVFNSLKDFYSNDAYDKGSKSVFDIINYNVIDVLVIFYDNFYDASISDEIIQNAKESDVPVIVIGAEKEGCYSIIHDYKESYKDIIRHVICDHGITDTCFVAGCRDNDPESVLRIQCYKEVLEENNLPFSDDMILYGGYWSVPARELALKQLEAGNRPPRGIICANDAMAITLCETLHEFGYRIPEDIAIVGFDGIPDGEFFPPRLTTCKEDIPELAQICIETATDALKHSIPCCTRYNHYAKSIHQSCGCTEDKTEPDNCIRYLFQATRSLEQHEAYMHSWLDRMLSNSNSSRTTNLLAQCIPAGSYVCLNTLLLTSIRKFTSEDNSHHLPDELICITSKDTHRSWDALPVISLAEMIPNPQEWTAGNQACIITPLFVQDKVCGYLASMGNDIAENAHIIHRTAKTINIAFNSILNQLTQKYMQISIENAAHSNPVTGLTNLKGAVSWFEDFSFIEKNHHRALTISIYSLPEYKYIYENYGIKDIEEILCTMADILEECNPDECLITHISEDEFVTINYFDDADSAREITNASLNAFSTKIEQYNATSYKDYYVEANTGYTLIYPGWQGSLASYIRLARNEMYIKRIKSGMSAVVKEQNITQDYYNSFNLLLEMNLFDYHFQPIVNAKTGDIYAYEALMRPDSSIGMNPLQVLETAGAYKRLYDIEKCTIFNVMERFSKDFDKFSGRKVFINSIPGYFLNEADNQAVSELYSDYMKYVVFEITEQNSVSDEELAAIKRVGNVRSDNHIAIDDYGTGHSNIVNLMRYTPQIIKIDRFLISDIHKDNNKQMFVRSTIEFARLNDIQVLAEGVELSEELQTVIQLGVDYIQGYYTGRPTPDPIPHITDSIRAEIQRANYAVV